MSKQLELLQSPWKNILEGIDSASGEYKIAGLTKKGEKTLFDYVTNSNDLLLEYSPTVLSPKKFFFPHEEVILEYDSDGKVAPIIEAEKLILFGIRPCDANSIKIMDEAFSESYGDPNYLAKREMSIIIGIDCKSICDDDAFCYNVKSNYATAGFDIMIHPNGKINTLSVNTEKGKNFIEKYIKSNTANNSNIEKYLKEKEKGFKNTKPFKDLDRFPILFKENKDHEIWTTEGDKCLSCGSCILGCPTCYCFDVADELALSLKEGERIRRWDACMLSRFAEVAGGENFRENKAERLKHRINRKFLYLMEKHGQSVCVGCGRCVRACLAEISPKTIAQVINGEKE